MLACSNLGALRISVVAQFWTCWNLLIMYKGRPAKDKRNSKFLCCGSVKKMAYISRYIYAGCKLCCKEAMNYYDEY